MLAVNLKAYFLCARACHDSMAASGHGQIVNVSSMTVPVRLRHACSTTSRRRAASSASPARSPTRSGPTGSPSTRSPRARSRRTRRRSIPTPRVYNRCARAAVPEAARHAGGHRQPRRLPRQRRLVVHHRPDGRDRRRLGDALTGRAMLACSTGSSPWSPAPARASARRSRLRWQAPARASPSPPAGRRTRSAWRPRWERSTWASGWTCRRPPASTRRSWRS